MLSLQFYHINYIIQKLQSYVYSYSPFIQGQYGSIYLILLMLIETTIIEQISTKNLVKVTLSQVQLENNFEIILKALKSHDSSIASLMSKVNTLENSTKNHQIKLDSKHREHQEKKESSINEEQLKKRLKEFEINHQQVKDLSATVKEIKDRTNLLQNLTKEMNEKIQKNEEESQQNKNQHQQMRDINELTQQRLEKIEKQMSNLDKINQRLNNLQRQLQEQLSKIAKLDQSVKQMDSIIKNKDRDTNQNLTQESINKLIKELEAKFNQKISQQKKQTQTQIQRLYGLINDINKNQITKINDSLDDHSKTIKRLSEDIWKLNDQLYKQTSNDVIDPKKISELERKIEQLRQNLNRLNHQGSHFSKLYSTTQKTPKKIEQPELSPSPNKISQSNQREETKDLNQIKQDSTIEDKTNFKKQIIDKLKQQKGDFNKALKKLDNFNLKKEQEKEKIGSLQEKILRIEHILDGKIDEQGMKKWMRYIENKINYLYRIVNVESPEEDACIARKNWICLSCDKKLDAYKGKVGNHLISAQLKAKNIEQDVVGGGMLFRSKSRYEMPSVKK